MTLVVIMKLLENRFVNVMGYLQQYGKVVTFYI